jgi:damage-control phosphatase, subfamily I
MIFEPGCLPCIINQAYNFAKTLSNDNKIIQQKIIREVCALMANLDGTVSAPFYSSMIQKILEDNLNRENIFMEIKEKNLLKAENYIKQIENQMHISEDKLEMAIRIAIIGNTIDIAANHNFNLEEDISLLTSDKIKIDSYPLLKEDINKANHILYIGDNYEEAIFDKFLLEQLPSDKTTFAVRSVPIYNDITIQDAHKLQIDKICKVIESGSKISGTNLNTCNTEFIDAFNKADIVLAKGQGNYETLIDVDRPVYFLFKVKCGVISSRCNYPPGSGVLYYKN